MPVACNSTRKLESGAFIFLTGCGDIGLLNERLGFGAGVGCGGGLKREGWGGSSYSTKRENSPDSSSPLREEGVQGSWRTVLTRSWTEGPA